MSTLPNWIYLPETDEYFNLNKVTRVKLLSDGSVLLYLDGNEPLTLTGEVDFTVRHIMIMSKIP